VPADRKRSGREADQDEVVRVRRPPPQPRPRTSAESVLQLQRTIGNAATRQILRTPTQQDRFRVVVVPDGETGVSETARNHALRVVRQELGTVTGRSSSRAVRGGFTVEYRDQPGDLEGLHRRVFLVYLMQGRDADRAVQLARPHLPRGFDDALRDQARELNSIGGTNLRVDFDSGRSPSVSFASTGALVELARGRDGGERLVGQLLGEIILHELGHALKAPHDEGIMQGRVVFDAATLGRPRHFSSGSVTAMRERLEYLADR